MKIAHFSDTHLGYRAYGRLNSIGLDQREADVFNTFERFADSILEREPDVIVHSGDFFDAVRPSNHTIVRAYRALEKIQQKRGGRPFIIVAGNHETPRSAELGCILRLFGDEEARGIPGVHVVIQRIMRIETGGLEALCIPTRGFSEREKISVQPQSGRRVSIIAAHGLDACLGLSRADFEIDEFHPAAWDYIALGDFHCHRKIAPNAAYCGSTDFASTSIWEEAGTPKGWVLFESDTKRLEFVQVPPARPVIDLEPIDAGGLSGAEIGLKLVEAAVWADGNEPIVRQRLRNVHPTARTEIPAATLRELKNRALHYKVEIELTRPEGAGGASEGGAVRTLEDEWREFARRRELPAGVERGEYVSVGVQLLGEAEDDSAEA